MMISISIIIYLVTLILFSLFKSNHFQGKSFYLLRAFFPSWKFYEDLGDVPILFYRIKERGSIWTPWKNCVEKKKRKWTKLFLNSQGNVHLAYGSLLQHLVTDIQEIEDSDYFSLKSKASYQLVQNLVLFEISKTNSFQSGMQYEFKVSSWAPCSPSTLAEDILLSPTYEV
jgi:hypothetical protein